ncbi:MAG: hypothetical protein WBD23_12305, partial [Candidatus Acidiferrales bacterium]
SKSADEDRGAILHALDGHVGVRDSFVHPVGPPAIPLPIELRLLKNAEEVYCKFRSVEWREL